MAEQDPSILPSQSYPKQFSGGEGGGSADFVTPYKLGSGVMRGTQIIQNTDGSQITLGNLPNSSTQFGITFIDPSGNTISTNTGATQMIYDISTGKNIIQIGKLPDGTYGMAVAKAGFNVSEAFS